MDYKVNLECFQGPLDLLLHLIEKQELNIYDIPISVITDQYLSHIENLDELNLDFACDFLVMAATLLAIKAKMLLPKPKKEIIHEEAEEDDPRSALVQHLLSYKKVKEAAQILKGIERQQRLKIARPIDKEYFISVLFPDMPVFGLGMNELLGALENLLKKSEPEKAHMIQKKQYFIKNQMNVILAAIKSRKRLLFRELFVSCPTVLEIIVTFLALLELSKQQKVRVIQEDVFGQITILKN
ncbi:MAG: segregation/condensation protein A [Clostridia bacterium]|nr:segregation/condensation protein A [Clostridia bacterium]